MATIRAAIQMYDGMSPAIRSMNNALNIVISSFEALQNTSSHAVDTRSIQAARTELNRAEAAFGGIEESIRQADRAQQQLNNDIRNGQGTAGAFASQLKGWATSIGAVLGVREIIQASDDMASATARLNLMNDKLQTTAQLQDMIFQSAQRARSSYLDTVQVVSKLGILAGDSFSSSQEIVAFAEQMNKQFKIGGSSIQEQTAAMYQLTQAMASGRLQGDEFRTIRESAPKLAQEIEKYMGDQGIKGSIKDWSAQGLITADVIKNAMFAAADETDAAFAALPMTWGQVWTSVVNNLLKYSQPLLNLINVMANNWSTLGPIFLALTTAALVYAAGLGVLTVASWIATGAAKAFFTTLISHPILLGVALAVGVLAFGIYKLVQSVGGIQVAWLIASNVILTAWDKVRIAFATGIVWVINLFGNLTLKMMSVSVAIQNYMGDMRTGVLSILQSMVNGAIGIINNFINLVNNIPGVSIDTIQKVTFGTTAQIKNDTAQKARNADLQGYKNQFATEMAGYNNELNNMISNAQAMAYFRQTGIHAAKNGSAGGSDFDSLISNVADTAANTGKMADAMDISEEDLKYLRDLADREVIDRTVLRDVKVSLSNTFGDIRETADIDGIIGKIETRLADAIANEAEGSYSV